MGCEFISRKPVFFFFLQSVSHSSPNNYSGFSPPSLISPQHSQWGGDLKEALPPFYINREAGCNQSIVSNMNCDGIVFYRKLNQ